MNKRRSVEEIVAEINYDESKIPEYSIPPLLVKNDGSAVENSWDWMNFRRAEILNFYREEVFGDAPLLPEQMSREVLTVRHDALGGKAIRKEIRLTFTHQGHSRSWTMLLYIPVNASGKVPVVLGLNFKGNHASAGEDDVLITGLDLAGNPVSDERGCQSHRWPFEAIIDRGFAAATVCYHDIYPDFSGEDALRKSIYGLVYPQMSAADIHRKHSAIGAWAWGLSRMLDALGSEEHIDTDRAMVTGHSRLGKTALWAGAVDLRFKVVVSNDSGHGGAALFRRCIGENAEVLVTVFPHWFVSGFDKYAGKDADLPFDQHFLLSLIAPRTLCIGSATKDLWADPKGEFLAGVHASEVYWLFGVRGMPVSEHPAPDVNVTGEISYHLRTGEHEILLQDWEHYLDAAGKIFDRK
ncbi:MAG: acetylxylan esterase [Lentisphaerae bacterium]|nr:acetylxylan esterase [Lentisphaerota bacterium]